MYRVMAITRFDWVNVHKKHVNNRFSVVGFEFEFELSVPVRRFRSGVSLQMAAPVTAMEFGGNRFLNGNFIMFKDVGQCCFRGYFYNE